jgi:hypothetical protein
VLFAGRLDDKIVKKGARTVYQVILMQIWGARSLVSLYRLPPLLLGLAIARSSQLWELDEGILAPIS